MNGDRSHFLENGFPLSLALASEHNPRMRRGIDGRSWYVCSGDHPTKTNWFYAPDKASLASIFDESLGDVIKTKAPAYVFSNFRIVSSRSAAVRGRGTFPLMMLNRKEGDMQERSDISVIEARDKDSYLIAKQVRFPGEDLRMSLEAIKRMEAIIEDPRVFTYLGMLRIDGLDLATTAAQAVLSGHDAMIWNMRTYEPYQGRGVGTAVLEHMVAQLSGKGAQRFWLLSTEEGLPLYKKVGFEVQGELGLTTVVPKALMK